MQKHNLTKAILSHTNTRQAAALIQALQAQGTSFGDITQELNKNGFRTAQENIFDTEMVKTIFDRMADIEQINRELSENV